MLVAASVQLKVINSEFKRLEPEKKVLGQSKKERDTLSEQASIVQQLIKTRLNCSEKLNRLSLSLPNGVWFDELALNNKDFILKGSVVSLQKEEMALINKFISNLKADAPFFNDFIKLDLTSAKKRQLGSYEVEDFILTGSLKPK